MSRLNIKPQVDHYDLPGDRSIYLLAEGAAGEPRLRGRPSGLCDVQFVHEPGAGATGPVDESGECSPRVYRLPKKLDEEVARLHLEKIGVKLTKLSKKQADYTSECRWKDLTNRSTTGIKAGLR